MVDSSGLKDQDVEPIKIPFDWLPVLAARAALRCVALLGRVDIGVIRPLDRQDGYVLAALRPLLSFSRWGTTIVVPDKSLAAANVSMLEAHLAKNPVEIERFRDLLHLFAASHYVIHMTDPGILGNVLFPASINAEPPWIVDSLSNASQSDIASLSNGADLWGQLLWLDDIPEWAAQGWENLATELTKRSAYWKTLVRWYEDRLLGDDWAASQGRPAIPELEIARASLPDSYWKKGGKAVNLAIAELEDFFWNNVPLKDPALRDLVNGIGVVTDDEEGEIIKDDTSAPLDALPPIEALPEQSASGMTFGRSAGGAISLAPPSGNDVLLATPDRIEDYLELRRKAMDVLAEGANRLGRLGKPLHLFCELPADLTSVRAKVLWGHINALRIVLKGHDEAVRAHAAGLDPDDRRLDGFAADGLQDIVETANVFFAGDPNLIDLDAIRRGPREQAEAKAEIARIEKPLKEALKNGAITEAETGVIVEAQITTALNAPDTLDGRQATELGAKTVRNYVAVFVRFVRSELGVAWKGAREGAYREIGKEAFLEAVKRASPYTQEAIQYIAVHANELLGYVHTAFQNADLETLIRILSQLN